MTKKNVIHHENLLCKIIINDVAVKCQIMIEVKKKKNKFYILKN